MGVFAATPPVAAPLQDAVSLAFGPYVATIGTWDTIKQDALALRQKTFGRNNRSDEDRFDSLSHHGTVVDTRTNKTAVAFRLRVATDVSDLAHTYTGQFYDLGPLHSACLPVLDLGRLCHEAAQFDPMAFRLAWAAIYRIVARDRVALIMGCASFTGADPDQHQSALGHLKAHHLGPEVTRPMRKSPLAVDLPDSNNGNADLPHLLQAYLRMGGWVSDHAVCDPDLDTIHVFTGLSVADIPTPRKRRLVDLANSTIVRT